MENHMKEILVFLIAVLVVLSARLYYKMTDEKKQKHKLAKENRKLIAGNALLEAAHLEFQLQPHTLRNMIATLHVASKNLYNGSEALANTLDYVLYNGNKHLVSIENELTFIENYKSLQGNFVHQINSIQIDKSLVNINSKYFTSACVPHLITAYFIENAFKHGDVNHPDFLNIRLKLSGKTFEIVVINRINQKPNKGKGGLGLINMQKRLDLLLSGKYEIKNNCTEQEYYSTLTINF